MLLVVFSRGESYQVWYVLGLVPVAIAFLIRYISYRYRFGPDELIIREGILTRNERHIPYSRIQNIDLTRNPLHRALNVAEVRIETASGGKPEAVIRVLSMDAIVVMRRRVFHDEGTRDETVDADGETVAARGSTLVELPLKEVVLYGLFSNRGLIVVAAAMGLATQAGIFDQDWEAWGRRFLPRVDFAAMEFVQLRIAMVASIGVASVTLLIVLTRLLSMGLAVFKLYGFRLIQRGDDLRAEYGLLTRITATIPRHRIQLLSTHESRLHRAFGRSSIQVETAGGGGSGDGSESARDLLWIAPVTPRRRVAELVSLVLPEIDLDSLSWRKVEHRAWKRIVKRGLILLGFIALLPMGSVRLVGWPVLWILLPALLVAVLLLVRHARRWIEETAYAVTPNAIVFRSGWWGRRLSVVGFNKIQAVEWSQSPFDRRHRMASLSVDTAGAGRTGHRIDIPYLDETVASTLRSHLAEQADRSAFRW